MTQENSAQLKSSEKKGVITLSLKGRLDSLNAEQILQSALKSLEGKTDPKVLCDFSILDYISSAGFRVLIIFGKHIKKINGYIVLFFEDNQKIKNLFQITGLDKVFSIAKNEEEALKLLISRPKSSL